VTIDSERHLRHQLGEALDGLAPSPAPVSQVLKGASGVRARRKMAAAAIIAAAISTAAIVIMAGLPGLRSPGSVSPRHAQVLGLRGGVAIGAGRVHGRPWQVAVSQAEDKVCGGVAGLQRTCLSLGPHQRLAGVATLGGGAVAVPGRFVSFGPPTWNWIFGTVAPAVTRLDFRLGNGATIKLRPVSAAGYRWVGLVFPFGVGVTRATAYAGRAELASSVPFAGGELRPGLYFVSWLRPGESSPAYEERYIVVEGSGGSSWDALVIAGPWGYCISLSIADGARQNCFSVDSVRAAPHVVMRWGSLPAVPRWIVGTAAPDVAYLHLVLADGRTMTVGAAEVGGQRFYAMKVSAGISRWAAFSKSGHRLYGGRGAPDTSR
jgi:hypothetical protein